MHILPASMASTVLPIQNLSYSSLMCFLRNAAEFRRIYLLKIYRERQNPALVVGKAFHKCLELYYKGHSKEQALEIGFQLIHDLEPTIDFGKTGSLEKVLEDYRKTVEHYYADGEQFVRKEHVISSEQTFRGNPISGVPLKAVSDLVLREPGISEPSVVDFKKVATFTLRDADGNFLVPRAYYIQSVFNYLTIKATMGVAPRQMTFLEVKTSKNKDEDEPQAQAVKILMTTPEYAAQIRNVEALASRMISLVGNESVQDALYLPNVSDMMGGDESYDDWVEGLEATGVET